MHVAETINVVEICFCRNLTGNPIEEITTNSITESSQALTSSIELFATDSFFIFSSRDYRAAFRILNNIVNISIASDAVVDATSVMYVFL
jgi:hypothetical protein